MSKLQNLNLMVITDELTPGAPPLRQKGATTRLVARAAEELRARHDVCVNYFGVKAHYDFLTNFLPEAPTAAILIRSQYNEMLDIARHLTAKNVATFFHLADAHVKNTDPKMADRVKLHTKLLRLCAGVIASSPANAEVGKEFNANTHYIPDAADADSLLPPSVRRIAPVRWFSAGYPLHHASFHRAAEILAGFEGKYNLHHEYTVCTGGKKATESTTHAALSGKDYFSALVERSEQMPNLFTLIHPFLPDSMYKALEEASFALIPADPLDELTPFQRFWFPKKAEVRVVTALAHGKLPIVEKPFPASYEPFVEKGAILVADHLSETIEEVLRRSFKDIKARIQEGQNIVREKFAAPVVAKQHLALYQQALK